MHGLLAFRDAHLSRSCPIRFQMKAFVCCAIIADENRETASFDAPHRDLLNPLGKERYRLEIESAL